MPSTGTAEQPLTPVPLAAVFNVSTASLDFGEQQVGTASAPHTVTVTNTGTSSLYITGIVMGGSQFTVSPGTGSVLAAGASQDYVVIFQPTSTGSKTATLSIMYKLTSAGVEQTAVVTLTGTGVSPSVSVSPSSMDFGEQRVGSSSTRAVVVSNTGTGTLVINSITLSGSSAAAYSVSPSTLSLPPNGSGLIQVSFVPAAEGVASATLTLSTNDAAQSIVEVALTGTGVRPMLALSPTSLDFGEQRVGTSGSLTVTATNVGTGTLTLSNAVISGPNAAVYTVTPSTLSLPPAGSGTLVVTFAPTTQGMTSATLTLSTNESGRPTVSIPLTGAGVSPSVSVTPSALDFGEQRVGATAATHTVVVANTGTGTLSLSGFNLSGPGAAAYSVSPDTLLLPAGTSGVLTVSFAPAVEGEASATLTLFTNDVARPSVVIELTGRGVSPVLALTPAALDFGAQRVGTSKTLVLTASNAGTGTLTLSNAVISGPNAAVYTVTPSTLSLPPSGSANLVVTFAPIEQGAATATLTLTTNDVNVPTATVALSGTGTSGASLQVSPAQVDFGNVVVGTSSDLRVVTVSNTGVSALVLNALVLSGQDVAAFTLAGISLPATLQPGASLEVGVRLLPDAARQFSAQLQVESDVSSATVALTGMGVQQPLHVSESSLEFGSVPLHALTSHQVLHIINGGDSPATLSALELEGDGAAQFSVEKPSLPLVLAPGQEQTVEVGFSPQAVASVSGTLTVVFSAPALDLEVALHGQGIASAISVEPASLDFGSAEVGEHSAPQSVTLTNVSSQAQQVVVKLKDASGSVFTVDTASLAAPVAASGTSTFQVSFQPQAVGEAQNEVQVWIQGDTEPSARIAVKGTGTQAKGGCSIGGTGASSSGGLVLLVLAALASRRWRRARG